MDAFKTNEISTYMYRMLVKPLDFQRFPHFSSSEPSPLLFVVLFLYFFATPKIYYPEMLSEVH